MIIEVGAWNNLLFLSLIKKRKHSGVDSFIFFSSISSNLIAWRRWTLLMFEQWRLWCNHLPSFHMLIITFKYLSDFDGYLFATSSLYFHFLSPWSSTCLNCNIIIYLSVSIFSLSYSIIFPQSNANRTHFSFTIQFTTRSIVSFASDVISIPQLSSSFDQFVSYRPTKCALTKNAV